MKTYIITDTHFNHKKLIEYGRPDNFDDLLWKELGKLPSNCLLIHLGDVCIGNDLEVHERLRLLPFIKILVKGNHDKKSDNWYLEKGWDFVCEQFTNTYFGKKILFSHIPVAWDGYYELNIHGHFHDSDHRRHETGLMAIKNGYQKLLAMEYTNYKPVLLEEFIKN
jgi:calcineurin-like phosphoesterase family protein